MDAELIQAIISVIIVVVIVVFLAKKAIKLAIAIAAILLIFNVAFLWNGDMLNEKLSINEYLEPEAATQVTEFFNDFAKKRDEYGVLVDSQEVYDKITDGVKEGTIIIVKGLGKIDIKKFADTMAEKIYTVGSENIDWAALEAEIKKQLGEVSQEDVDKILTNIKEDVAAKETT